MIKTTENQTIALAGLFLATELVQKVASDGQYNEADMRVALESIFTPEADSVEQIYGSKQKLRSGYQRLVSQLSGNGKKPDMQITQYTLTLLKIENKCQSKPEVMDRIRHGINHGQNLAESYDTLDPQILEHLATIYTNNISNLSPGVVVQGNREYLEQEHHANAIRAALLAGLRAAVLWRQCGGSRWKVVAGRGRYVDHANEELRSL